MDYKEWKLKDYNVHHRTINGPLVTRFKFFKTRVSLDVFIYQDKTPIGVFKIKPK